MDEKEMWFDKIVDSIKIEIAVNFCINMLMHLIMQSYTWHIWNFADQFDSTEIAWLDVERWGPVRAPGP